MALVGRAEETGLNRGPNDELLLPFGRTKVLERGGSYHSILRRAWMYLSGHQAE